MKLTALVTDYIAFKQTLGLRYRTDTYTLQAFCRALGDIDLAEVTLADVESFLNGCGPVTSAWHKKFEILNRFYRFAQGREWVTTVPLPRIQPLQPPPCPPYIYTSEELDRLLAVTETLQSPTSPLQAITFRTLWLLLYGSGLRISEALALTLADVDLQNRLLTVHRSKFYKTRWVPTGPKLTAQLADYVQQRRRLPCPAGEASTFFATRTGRPLSYRRVQKIFQRLRQQAHICRHEDARYQPRLHDIRHTAAVHRLIAWYRDGADVQRLLPQLATYLGHVELASTQRYLTLTPELLEQANRRFEDYALAEDGHD
jgi:site-specific recombinase XerD